MKITSIRVIQGGVPLPEPRFWPAWWPGHVIREIGFSIAVIETDEGLAGFGPGSARVSDGRWAAEPFMRDQVLDADPFRIGALVSAPENLPQMRHGRPLYIELALWDLLGKATGQPVYKLLGGYRSQVAAYCSTGSLLSPEEHIDQAWEAHARGYRAIKLRLHRPDLADDLRVVRAVREALPDEMEIMADANQAQNPFWSRATALQAARALEEEGVVWLEEPLPLYDVEGLRELRTQVEIPIAGAEGQRGLYAFRHCIDQRLFDILQPDLVGCGGLLEYRQIAALCHAHLMPCIPHLWSNGLMMACMLHAIGSVPNAPYAECTDDVLWPASIRDRILQQPFEIIGGKIQVPDGPGWGVELDWEAVERYAHTDARIST
jgi:L-alanine-DL-glutamate epimerase-like enolase superfamily enzyme